MEWLTPLIRNDIWDILEPSPTGVISLPLGSVIVKINQSKSYNFERNSKYLEGNVESPKITGPYFGIAKTRGILRLLFQESYLSIGWRMNVASYFQEQRQSSSPLWTVMLWMPCIESISNLKYAKIIFTNLLNFYSLH